MSELSSIATSQGADSSTRYQVTLEYTTATSITTPYQIIADSPVEAAILAPVSHHPNTVYTVSWFPSETKTIRSLTVTDAEIRAYITAQIEVIGRDCTAYLPVLSPLTDRDDDLSRQIADAVMDQYSEWWVSRPSGDAPYYMPCLDTAYSTPRALADALYDHVPVHEEQSGSGGDRRYHGTVRAIVEVCLPPTETPTGIVKSKSGFLWLVTETGGTARSPHRYPLGLFEGVEQVSVGTPYVVKEKGNERTAVLLTFVGQRHVEPRSGVETDVSTMLTESIRDELTGYSQDGSAVTPTLLSVDILRVTPEIVSDTDETSSDPSGTGTATRSERSLRRVATSVFSLRE